MDDALTTTEAADLARHEATIDQGLKTFMAVGSALAAIRDARLYRLGHATFEDYCRERWGLKQSRAYQLMDAASVVGHLESSTIVELPANEAQARPLVGLPPGRQLAAWVHALATLPTGERMTAAHVERAVAATLASHQLINQSKGREWYTPAPYVEAARELMAGIDLDPASNALANQVIRATTFYTADDDGLAREWRGRVWLNPPYGKEDGGSNQARWSRRLIDDYRAGRVAEAVLLVNAVPGNHWFAPLWDFPICFVAQRIRFYNADVEAGDPTHSNALVYFGPNAEDFRRIFSRFGVVAVKMSEAA